MNLPDMINGAFEASAGAFSILNVIAIRKSRSIAGVHWLPTCVFSAWGVFNLYYYPHLGQWFSFVGGLSIASINMTWLAHVWYYATRGRHHG